MRRSTSNTAEYTSLSLTASLLERNGARAVQRSHALAQSRCVSSTSALTYKHPPYKILPPRAFAHNTPIPLGLPHARARSSNSHLSCLTPLGARSPTPNNMPHETMIAHSLENEPNPLLEPVGIIGSGIAGLITAHILLQDGFERVEVLTRDSSVGGVWSEERIYPGLRINRSVSTSPLPTPSPAAVQCRNLLACMGSLDFPPSRCARLMTLPRLEVVCQAMTCGSTWRILPSDP
jgi:hypothetical protein